MQVVSTLYIVYGRIRCGE